MKTAFLAILAVGALALAGCTSNNTPPPSGETGAKANLLGDGSSFVQPLMDKWRTSFSQQNGGVTISYTGGGSGKGRGDITKNLVDFAGTDAPMSAAEQANATDVLHLPIAAGGVAIAYNLPEASGATVKFNGDILAKIFLGKITRWNDPALVALNPGVTLPAQDIQVVHRSDGSGTTATFTDYLVKISPDWAAGPGKGSTVVWPCEQSATPCTGAQGNPGVGGQIQKVPYSLGYVGAEWTNISKIQTGVVLNKAGSYVSPTPAAASAALDAALAAGAFDENLKGSATNQDGANSYPITAVTWLLVHQHQADAAKGKALVGFLHYVLHDGQTVNLALNYAPMPANLVAKADALVAKMDLAGQPIA